MANTKISALPSAGTLVDTDVLAGVQVVSPTENRKFALSDLKTYCRSFADVLIEGDIKVGHREGGQSNHIVRTAAGVYYYFFIANETGDIYYKKSSNYGISWGPSQLIKAMTGFGLAVWFDKWTPGNSGTVIHVAYMDSGGSDVFYRPLDTASDTLGTEITVFNGASAITGANTCLSVTVSKAGRVLVAFDIDGGTEVGLYKSDAATPTAFSTIDGSGAMHEAVSADYYLLLPGNYADTNDIDIIFWDRSANEITLKTLDDSAASVSESAAITGMTDLASTTVAPQFAAASRNSDGHIILVAWENADTLGAKLRCWDINGAASITEKTNIVSSSTDDQALCAVSIDTDNDYIWAFYAGKTDGSETCYTALNIYYKKSTDGGATWGSETLLSSRGAQAITNLNAALEIAGAVPCVAWAGVEATGFGMHAYNAAYR